MHSLLANIEFRAYSLVRSALESRSKGYPRFLELFAIPSQPRLNNLSYSRQDFFSEDVALVTIRLRLIKQRVSQLTNSPW
jgi:hypothetical protein